MKKILLGLALLSVSVFSSAEVYDLQCVKSGDKPVMVHAQADTSTGAFVFGGEKYNRSSEQSNDTEIAITYDSQYTKNVFLLLIDTVNNKSKYILSDGKTIKQEGICFIDESVLI